MVDLHVCTFETEPGATECWVAIWSQGRNCRKCTHRCYRQGWSKRQVDADNARLVKLNCEDAAKDENL